MYSLIVALLVTSSCVAASFDKIINTYFEDYKVFDILVTTKMTPLSINENLEKIDGIKAVSGKLSVDKCIEFENGRTLLTRIMSDDSNENWKIYDVKKQTILNQKKNCVMVSAYFAEYNNIEIDSNIYIIDGQDRIKLTVTNIISSPETIGFGSYIGSWYDMRDYGFIYVSSDLKEEVFKTNELCNVYKILVDDDANIDKIEERIKEIISEDYLISISRYED